MTDLTARQQQMLTFIIDQSEWPDTILDLEGMRRFLLEQAIAHNHKASLQQIDETAERWWKKWQANHD